MTTTERPPRAPGHPAVDRLLRTWPLARLAGRRGRGTAVADGVPVDAEPREEVVLLPPQRPPWDGDDEDGQADER